MPLEIKELTVKINVTENIGQRNQGVAKQINKNLRKEIVQECIEKVLDALDRQKNR